MGVSIDVHYVELDADSVMREPPPDGDYAVIHYGLRSPFATPYGDIFPWQIEVFRFKGGLCDSVCLSSAPVKILSEWPIKKVYLIDLPNEKRREMFENGRRQGVRFLPAA